jgi:hypothetical protein
MIVSDLITILQTMPQDAKVIITTVNIQQEKWDNEVRDVIYNDPKYVKDSDAGTVELDNWPAEDY